MSYNATGSKEWIPLSSEDGFTPSYIPKFKDVSTFVDAKIKILSDLAIKVTEEEELTLRTLKTEVAINRAVRDIINDRWK